MSETRREAVIVIVDLVDVISLPLLGAEPLAELPDAVLGGALARAALGVAFSGVGNAGEGEGEGREQGELHDG